MSAADVVSRYSQAGFYMAPLTKVLMGCGIAGFGALQIPALGGMHKFLVCKVPESLMKGEVWRLLTAKLFFLDARDHILSMILLYHFRMFERRLGSRRFASRLLSSMLLSTMLEVFFTATFSAWAKESERATDFSGILAVGPFHLTFPWFALFYSTVPALNAVSASPFGSLGSSFTSFSTKSFTYFMGFNIMIASNANIIAGLSGLVAGLLVRKNFLWVQDWLVIPSRLSQVCHSVFGRLVESGPPAEGAMGATLEIQRAQQMEAIEQQMFRQQQARMAAAAAFGGGGARNRGRGLAAAAALGMPPPPGANAGLPPPAEDSIQMLVDMGFARPRVERALARAGNDVQAATVMLLQEND